MNDRKLTVSAAELIEALGLPEDGTIQFVYWDEPNNAIEVTIRVPQESPSRSTDRVGLKDMTWNGQSFDLPPAVNLWEKRHAK